MDSSTDGDKRVERRVSSQRLLQECAINVVSLYLLLWLGIYAFMKPELFDLGEPPKMPAAYHEAKRYLAKVGPAAEQRFRDAIDLLDKKQPSSPELAKLSQTAYKGSPSQSPPCCCCEGAPRTANGKAPLSVTTGPNQAPASQEEITQKVKAALDDAYTKVVSAKGAAKVIDDYDKGTAEWRIGHPWEAAEDAAGQGQAPAQRTLPADAALVYALVLSALFLCTLVWEGGRIIALKLDATDSPLHRWIGAIKRLYGDANEEDDSEKGADEVQAQVVKPLRWREFVLLAGVVALMSVCLVTIVRSDGGGAVRPAGASLSSVRTINETFGGAPVGGGSLTSLIDRGTIVTSEKDGLTPSFAPEPLHEQRVSLVRVIVMGLGIIILMNLVTRRLYDQGDGDATTSMDRLVKMNLMAKATAAAALVGGGAAALSAGLSPTIDTIRATGGSVVNNVTPNSGEEGPIYLSPVINVSLNGSDLNEARLTAAFGKVAEHVKSLSVAQYSLDTTMAGRAKSEQDVLSGMVEPVSTNFDRSAEHSIRTSLDDLETAWRQANDALEAEDRLRRELADLTAEAQKDQETYQRARRDYPSGSLALIARLHQQSLHSAEAVLQTQNRIAEKERAFQSFNKAIDDSMGRLPNLKSPLWGRVAGEGSLSRAKLLKDNIDAMHKRARQG